MIELLVCMYVCHTNQIGATVQSSTNQIAASKGASHVRRFEIC